MESFNWVSWQETRNHPQVKFVGITFDSKFTFQKHVVAAFFDVEKAFDNVWHNGLRYKIFMLDLPTKMTSWLSDFLVG